MNTWLELLVLALFLFAAIWPRVFIRIFVFYVSPPTRNAVLALRIACLAFLAWLVITLLIHKLK